jgi:putative tryptophan/tyrosine transport system substrate-binding protein
MKRREFITLLGGVAAAWPLAAGAQKKTPRLCFLTFDPGTFQSRSARFEPFFNRLNELGYVDGQTITIDYLSAEGRNDRFAEIAAECLRFKADVLAVTTTPELSPRSRQLKPSRLSCSRWAIQSALASLAVLPGPKATSPGRR